MSIVIAAHNEEATISRLLTSLRSNAEVGEFDIYVVCNGCTDRTAELARAFGAGVNVIELPEPSKRAALKAGDDAATGFPRLYVDADVELSTVDVRALRSALRTDGVLAVGPERVLRLEGVPPLVRSYYAVWQRLPQVRSGLFGRGAIAVSELGHVRTSRLPLVMSDDLAISEAFSSDERLVVAGASVNVWPPRTLHDLIRRRIRVSTGNAELDQSEARSVEAKTSWADLASIVRERPRLALSVPVFVGVAIVAKIGARRKVRGGDFNTWLRDESSRQPGPGAGS
jgi:glycosyltransferase involved in cell wall biosynthesis